MGLLSSTANVLLIIVGFGFLIFVHELGHFLAAKWANIRAEGFAIGMGPVILAWRKGIGLRFRSTDAEYIRRAEEHLAGTMREKPLTREQVYRAADEIGLGETEYSLRILPIGGFVKMLGQEDANPSATSEDARSYNRCPVGKRMIVVSAGVIMNLLIAAVLFMITFSLGVQFVAAEIGDVVPGSPAAAARAKGAEDLETRGIEPRLMPGDRVIQIDGKPATTFADIQLASAMSRRDQVLEFQVQRDGISESLLFNIAPQHDAAMGLRSVGIIPPSSTEIEPRIQQGIIREQLDLLGLSELGIEPGMRLIEANGTAVRSFHQIEHAVESSNGNSITTKWTPPGVADDSTGELVEVTIVPTPRLQMHWYPNVDGDGVRHAVRGMLGLVPLQQVAGVLPDSPNREILKGGDVFVRVGSRAWPRQPELMQEIAQHAGKKLDVKVLRDGEIIDLMVTVSRGGRVGVRLSDALDTPILAEPLERTAVRSDEREANATETAWTTLPTPVEGGKLLAGSTIVAVDGVAVSNWRELRAALRRATATENEQNADAVIDLSVIAPTSGRDLEVVSIHLNREDVAALHELGWQSSLERFVFSSVMTTRSSDGNLIQAMVMGAEETWKVMLQTYLTFDRLFRGTIGIEQLRGPVGIVHLGFQIIDQGVLYLLFLLAAISVNLAVINFLPLPIVDGGLFLFLVYEKIKGRPPSVAFQNMAFIIGVAMIVSLILFVTWNDIWRLFQ